MSDSAPVVIAARMISSATRPPSATLIFAYSSSSERETRSVSGVESVTPSASARRFRLRWIGGKHLT
jgi:hypothetical protein